MVQGPNILKVDAIRIKYNKDIPLNAKMQTAIFIGMEEIQNDLRRKQLESRSISRKSFEQYQWYNNILQSELRNTSEDYKIHLVHWTAESNNVESFRVKGKLFNSLSKIVGATQEHWYASNRVAGQESIIFTGSYPRYLADPDAKQPYFHSMQHCSLYDDPCSRWQGCFRDFTAISKPEPEPKNDDDEYIVLYNQLDGKNDVQILDEEARKAEAHSAADVHSTSLRRFYALKYSFGQPIPVEY